MATRKATTRASRKTIKEVKDKTIDRIRSVLNSFSLKQSYELESNEICPYPDSLTTAITTTIKERHRSYELYEERVLQYGIANCIGIHSQIQKYISTSNSVVITTEIREAIKLLCDWSAKNPIHFSYSARDHYSLGSNRTLSALVEESTIPISPPTQFNDPRMREAIDEWLGYISGPVNIVNSITECGSSDKWTAVDRYFNAFFLERANLLQINQAADDLVMWLRTALDELIQIMIYPPELLTLTRSGIPYTPRVVVKTTSKTSNRSQLLEFEDEEVISKTVIPVKRTGFTLVNEELLDSTTGKAIEDNSMVQPPGQ